MLNGRHLIAKAKYRYLVHSITCINQNVKIIRFYHDNPVDKLEERANANPKDAITQAAFLGSALGRDPRFVIRRIETGKFAINDEVLRIYDRARQLIGAKVIVEDQDNISERPPIWYKAFKNFYTLFKLGTIFIAVPYIAYLMITEKGSGGILGMKDYTATIPSQTFEDVAGNKVAKKNMENLVTFLTDPDKFSNMGCTIPKGILLSGPPGVGKTLLAKALAGEAGVPFFFASGSEFDQMFVGLGASRIRSLFKAAKEASPSIIFIDEIDTVGMKRGSMSSNSTTLNQLLSEMDGFENKEGVIVLAATNDPQVLDEALIREGRFDNKITLSNPSTKDRYEILNVHCRNKRLSDDADLEYLAKACVGMSGAQLSTLANVAGLRAVQKKKPHIEQDDLEWARAKVLMGGLDSSMDINDEDAFKISAHEAGHVVMELLREEITEKRIYLATTEPRGVTLGHVLSINKEDVHSINNEQLIALIDVGLGGRAAEEVLYKDKTKISTGCAVDIGNITRLAQVLIEDNGYSTKQGLVRYSDSEMKNFVTNQLVQEEIKVLLDERYDVVKQEMERHDKQWQRIRDFLLEYKTLTGEECREIFNGGSPSRLPSEGLPSS